MEYIKRFFDPQPALQDFRDVSNNKVSQYFDKGDRRDGKLYLYSEKIVLAINVAIATGRVLLVRGRSGCGKSSLAYNVARVLNRRYYEYVVTSRTQARDLLWRFDAVRRLADAQLKGLEDIYLYLHPGVLWWAFDREGAFRKGQDTAIEILEDKLATDICIYPKAENKNEIQACGTVILIDEIDKADIDFPNNLLVALGALEFDVDEIGKRISFYNSKNDQNIENTPLIIVTTNEERELPEAFLRRCIVLEIEQPTANELVKIASCTEGNEEEDRSFYYRIVNKMVEMNKEEHINKDEGRVNFSTAEFLDVVRAIKRLKIDDIEKSLIFNMVIQKKRTIE